MILNTFLFSTGIFRIRVSVIALYDVFVYVCTDGANVALKRAYSVSLKGGGLWCNG